ncbi:MAG: OmpA family protein [Bradymonadales bacterium]|nr:OmpA family protein [Bradymonadales bacterium]
MSCYRNTRLPIALMLSALAAVLVSPPDAHAQGDPQVEFFINSPQMVGGDPPTLRISSHDHLEAVTLELRRQGSRQTFSLGEIRRGQGAEVTFECPRGIHTFQAHLSGQRQGRPFTVSFDFEFEIAEGLEVSIPPEQVDLAGHRLVLLMNRPAERVDYTVTRDDGVIIGEGSVPFTGQPAGTPLDVHWRQGEGTVLKIALTAHDTDGFWTEVEIIPWSVDIPHEEINFPTGSAVIPEGEQYKIDDAYRQVVEAVARFGEFVQIQLYVAGYTDTVGSNSDNQTLSEQRARSIARAFQERGFSGSIFYQGFGETVLTVFTPDHTDELANRRALYVLAAEPPLPSVQIPRSHWRPVN